MTDATDRFSDALISPDANAEIPAQSRIFEPFIGSWDLVVRWFDPDASMTRQEDGEWHFSRVLEGRAIQDVWIVPPRHARETNDYEYGTSLRFYDETIDGWRSTWIGPMRRAIWTFTARKVDDRVVLETTAGITPRMRWTFSEISGTSFKWTNEELDGDQWRVLQTFEARRAPP